MLNPERVMLNLVQNLQGRLVSASLPAADRSEDPETILKQVQHMVQGDNKTSIATAFWAFIAGLRSN